MGLKPIDDFRGRFTGKSDYEIYTWAVDRYWKRCSKDVIVWLGGEHGSLMLPGVADYGMMKKTFFNDLSARESDTLEYALTKKLLAEMKPLGQVMGWHSYKKDWEEEWVTLTSTFALTVDGLHTLPNTSFLCHVPASPDSGSQTTTTSVRERRSSRRRRSMWRWCRPTDWVSGRG